MHNNQKYTSKSKNNQQDLTPPQQMPEHRGKPQQSQPHTTKNIKCKRTPTKHDNDTQTPKITNKTHANTQKSLKQWWFPKDTRPIAGLAKKYKSNLSIVESVINSNNKRVNFLYQRIISIMKNVIKNKIITFLGVTFKPNTDDMRESPSLKLIPMLLKKGAKIRYYEPTGKKKELEKFKKVNYCKSINLACGKSDLIILHTEWNEFKILNFKKLVKKRYFKIYDLRNLYSPEKMSKSKINYFGVGR